MAVGQVPGFLAGRTGVPQRHSIEQLADLWRGHDDMPTLAPIGMSAGAPTDEGLLGACRAGDEGAFVTLVRRHHPALVALARCWPGQAHEAQRDVALAWLALVGPARARSHELWPCEWANPPRPELEIDSR